jgi:bacteriorhodopsin
MRFQINPWSLKKLHLYKVNSDWLCVKSCCLRCSTVMMPCVFHAIDFGKTFLCLLQNVFFTLFMFVVYLSWTLGLPDCSIEHTNSVSDLLQRVCE